MQVTHELTEVGRAILRRCVDRAHVERFIGVGDKVAEAGGPRQPLGEIGGNHPVLSERAEGVGVGCRRWQMQMKAGGETEIES